MKKDITNTIGIIMIVITIGVMGFIAVNIMNSRSKGDNSSQPVVVEPAKTIKEPVKVVEPPKETPKVVEVKKVIPKVINKPEAPIFSDAEIRKMLSDSLLFEEVDRILGQYEGEVPGEVLYDLTELSWRYHAATTIDTMAALRNPANSGKLDRDALLKLYDDYCIAEIYSNKMMFASEAYLKKIHGQVPLKFESTCRNVRTAGNNLYRIIFKALGDYAGDDPVLWKTVTTGLSGRHAEIQQYIMKLQWDKQLSEQ